MLYKALNRNHILKQAFPRRKISWTIWEHCKQFVVINTRKKNKVKRLKPVFWERYVQHLLEWGRSVSLRGMRLNLQAVLQVAVSGHHANSACVFHEVFFFPRVSPQPVVQNLVWKLSRAGPASSPVYTHCLAPFSWYLSEASRHYRNTIPNSNYCFLKHSVHSAWKEATVFVPFGFLYLIASLSLCNPSCLVARLAQTICLTSDPRIGRILLSTIACGLCCLFFVVFFLRVCAQGWYCCCLQWE